MMSKTSNGFSQQPVAKPYRRGLPIEISVNTLLNHFPDLKEGELIKTVDIEDIIGAGCGSSRFTRTVRKFRDQLQKDKGITLKTVSKVGYRVADPEDQMTCSRSNIRTGLTFVGRGISIAKGADPSRLSLQSQIERDHYIRIGATLTTTEATSRKQLNYPKDKGPGKSNIK